MPVLLLYQQPAADLLQVKFIFQGGGGVHFDHAEILLACQPLPRLFRIAGSRDGFHESFRHLLRRFSIERPAEQVSLLPYPRRIKEPAYTTISGVLRPLSRAATAWAAVFLVIWPLSLPIATLAAATAAMLLYTRHRKLYLSALEEALARHSVELAPVSRTPLVVDKEGLKVIDEALVDSEPMVVIFALSLLPRLPSADALPLLLPRLEHQVPAV